MVNGRYVAKIVIDFDFDPEKVSGVLPFDKLCEVVTGGKLTDTLREAIMDEVLEEGICTLTVEQQCANLYEVKADE